LLDPHVGLNYDARESDDVDGVEVDGDGLMNIVLRMVLAGDTREIAEVGSNVPLRPFSSSALDSGVYDREQEAGSAKREKPRSQRLKRRTRTGVVTGKYRRS